MEYIDEKQFLHKLVRITTGYSGTIECYGTFGVVIKSDNPRYKDQYLRVYSQYFGKSLYLNLEEIEFI